MFRRLIILGIALLSLALFEACDPGKPGPYAVGVTEFTFQSTSVTTGAPRLLDTVVWYPADESARSQAVDVKLAAVRDAKPATNGAPFPIIMWSHCSCCAWPYGYLYLAPFLATHGFVVIAPSHPGDTSTDCPSGGASPAVINDSYLNRPGDLMAALNSMLNLSNNTPASSFYQVLDGNRVGIMGHSFGGTDSVRESTTPGVPYKAALALAPCITAVGEPSQVEMPLMMFGGGLDTTCNLIDIRNFYNGIGGAVPHFLVVFPGASHNIYLDKWTQDSISLERAHQFIDFYATAFFETYLAGATGYAASLDPSVNAGDPDIVYSASP